MTVALAVGTPICVIPALVAGAGLMVLNVVTLNLTPVGAVGYKALTFVGNSLNFEANILYTLATGRKWSVYKYDEDPGCGLFSQYITAPMARYIDKISYHKCCLHPLRLILTRVIALAALILCIVPRVLEAIVVIPLAIASISMHIAKFVAEKRLVHKQENEINSTEKTKIDTSDSSNESQPEMYFTKKEKTKIEKYTISVDRKFHGALQFPSIVMDIGYLGTKVIFA